MTPAGHFRTSLILGLVLTLAAGTASANSIIRDLDRSGLTQDDLNMMMRGASDLYSAGQARVGASTTWSNPATRSQGEVEVTGVAGNCVTLVHRFRPRGAARAQDMRTRRCLTDGVWLLSAP